MRDRDLIFNHDPSADELWRSLERPWVIRSERRRTAAQRRRRYELLVVIGWVLLYAVALSPLIWAGLRG